VKPDLLTSQLCSAEAPPSEEDRKALAEAVYRAGYDFLLAGGRVSLSEWAALGPASREALTAAGDILRHEFARMLWRGPQQPPASGSAVASPTPKPDPLDAAADRLVEAPPA